MQSVIFLSHSFYSLGHITLACCRSVSTVSAQFYNDASTNISSLLSDVRKLGEQAPHLRLYYEYYTAPCDHTHAQDIYVPDLPRALLRIYDPHKRLSHRPRDSLLPKP